MKIHKTELAENFHRYGKEENLKVTLEHEGKYFAVNIPLELFEETETPVPHGLNLVYGEGEHYE